MADLEQGKYKESRYWMGSLIVALLATVILLCMPWWQVDDAFISYRYGKNWLETGELDWNPATAERVEGYTGILLPALAAASIYFGLPLPFAIQVLGILTLMLSIPATSAWLRSKGCRPSLHHIALALAFGPPLLYQHSVSGLETIFFIGLGLAIFAELAKPKPRPVVLSLVVAVLILCRPEGMLFLVGLALAALAKRKSDRLLAIRLLKASVFPAIVLGSHFLWRKSYYGEWLPNTFYAKHYEGMLNVDSLKQFLQFLLYFLSVPIVLGGGLMIHSGRLKFKPSQWSADALLWVVFGTGLLAAYLRSHLYMNYGHRFFLPLLVPAIVLLASWAESGLKGLAEVKKSTRRAFATLLFASTLCQLVLWAWQYREAWHFQSYYQSIMQDELIPAGKHLGKHFRKDEVLAVYMDAGAIGYYSGMQIIDFGRLNDKYLAKEPKSQREVVDYFFACKPRVAVFTSERQDVYSYIPEAEAILADPRFEAYVFAKEWANSAKYPYFQRLYIRQND